MLWCWLRCTEAISFHHYVSSKCWAECWVAGCTRNTRGISRVVAAPSPSHCSASIMSSTSTKRKWKWHSSTILLPNLSTSSFPLHFLHADHHDHISTVHRPDLHGVIFRPEAKSSSATSGKMSLWLLRAAARVQVLRGQHRLLRQQRRRGRRQPAALARGVPALVRAAPDLRLLDVGQGIGGCGCGCGGRALLPEDGAGEREPGAGGLRVRVQALRAARAER